MNPDTIGWVWTGKFDLSTLRVDEEIFESGKKKLRIQKYLDTCGRGLSEHLVTNGPEDTVPSKSFKSLELLKKSLQKMEDNIKDISTNPGFNFQLNLEALLTLHIENQYAVTHFKRDAFSLYEYALIFGSSVEEAVKRVSK